MAPTANAVLRHWAKWASEPSAANFRTFVLKLLEKFLVYFSVLYTHLKKPVDAKQINAALPMGIVGLPQSSRRSLKRVFLRLLPRDRVAIGGQSTRSSEFGEPREQRGLPRITSAAPDSISDDATTVPYVCQQEIKIRTTVY
ncbi:uncharacterized protein LOC105836671 isoform X2 [Monomorium pharaonis]|uniref:uncharacterized protein LOC105836671 isoform X2 n=1 Tax=Monomorium pharaonis TaxID=307658 RepID=UPI001746106D|nr:uncharacterized protein LOC105836671 isoform X2 [Monomorium pharaonis]